MELKKYRQMANKTQEEISKELDMPRSKYARYELKTAEPNIKTLIKIADHFHVSVDELLGHEVPYVINRIQFSEKQLEVINALKELNDEDCRYLLASISAIKTANQERENIIKKFK